MRKNRAARLIPPLILLLLCGARGLAQAEADGHLRVVQSPLKLQGEGVRFNGKQLTRDYVTVAGEKLVYNGVAYYFSDDDLDGLVAEDLKSRALVIYEPTELAITAGWLKKRVRRKESKDDDDTVCNNVRGYARVGDVIWMGTDGFGILAFDTKRKEWARYDVEAQPRPGRDSASIFYADEDYLFVGGFHIYSNKQKRWLRVDGVPTRYVHSLGYSGMYVQVMWDLRRYAREKYLPLSEYPNSLALGMPRKVTLREDGEAYIFKFGQGEAYTQFTIEKWQLEWAFSQVEPGASPQKSLK